MYLQCVAPTLLCTWSVRRQRFSEHCCPPLFLLHGRHSPKLQRQSMSCVWPLPTPPSPTLCRLCLQTCCSSQVDPCCTWVQGSRLLSPEAALQEMLWLQDSLLRLNQPVFKDVSVECASATQPAALTQAVGFPVTAPVQSWLRWYSPGESVPEVRSWLSHAWCNASHA